MITAYTGQALLGAALIFSLLQIFASKRLFTSFSFAYAQAFCVGWAFFLLIYAHVTDQFALLSVVLHSHTQKPLLYKIAGVWGNHEGSMLLWVFILSLYGALVSRQVQNRETPYPLVISLMGLMNFGFLLFMMMVCDPFALVETIPSEGQDLNPVLQDPSLAIHPPILYMGYVGFAIPFVFAATALIHGKIPENWVALLRPWALFAWTCLTLGVGLGSFWAYYELGWGGWWFWDPVENMSLMPWLAATALIHMICALNVTKAFQAWTLFLSILTFALCLLGTFFVRSGLLTSVHSFAFDPERGTFIFLLSCFLVLPVMSLFLWRLKGMSSSLVKLLSRPGLILMTTLILMSGIITIALGTFYPLILEVFDKKITVGTPYYLKTFIPIMMPLLIILGVSLWYSWLPQNLNKSSVRWVAVILGLTIIVGLIAYFGFGLKHILGLSAFISSVWAILGTLGYAIKRQKYRSGTILAHLGTGVAVLGMTLSCMGEKEIVCLVKEKETFSIASIPLTLKEVISIKGKNYQAHRAVFAIEAYGKVLMPEKRFYWTQKVVHGESAIQSVGWARLHHVYITLGEEYEGKQWSIHAYYKPFINLLWVGLLLIVIGGLMAFRKRFSALKKIASLWLLVLLPTLTLEAPEQLLDENLERRARALSQQIICPVCQGQTLDESPVEEAQHLRTEIRLALSRGETDEQIVNVLIKKYGPQIVRTPPMTWDTCALWFGPWVVFGVLMGLFLRRKYLWKRDSPSSSHLAK